MENKIPIGSRVTLKDGMEDVYMMAFPRSEGLVRDCKVDGDGFPLIFVEWDKDHWRYNGQKDGWTFEDHFDVKERGTGQQESQVPDLLAQLQQEPTSEAEAEEFFDELSEAFEHASEGEGFFVITIRRKEVDGAQILYPEVFASTLSADAGLLMEAQVAQIAAMSYQDMIARLVKQMKRGGELDD